MRLSGLFVVLAACKAGTTTVPASSPISSTSPTPAAATAPPKVTRAHAERALHDDAPLDYERPFNNKPSDRTETRQLFHARCKGGDKDACIVEAELIGYDAKLAYLRTVERNCREGHMMSCRALPFDGGPPRFPDLPGAMSRLNACMRPGVHAACDVSLLREECDEGFAQACFYLGSVDTSAAGDELLKRYGTLSMEGCRAGIASDCGSAALATTDLRERIVVDERLCDLSRESCTSLYYSYKAVNETIKARDAFERACQYGPPGTCADLGAKYRDGEFPEPVVGRGQALIDWACSKLVEIHRGELRDDIKATCDRATPSNAK